MCVCVLSCNHKLLRFKYKICVLILCNLNSMLSFTITFRSLICLLLICLNLAQTKVSKIY